MTSWIRTSATFGTSATTSRSWRRDPDRPTGNKSILHQFILHRSNDRRQRLEAAPLLFFENIVHQGREKGFWRFIGLGVLERAERVVQVDRHGRLFANYAFDCALIDLGPENLKLSWNWIAARRDPSWSLEDSLKLAPENWRRWVEQGSSVIDRIRQSIARYRILTRPHSARIREHPRTPRFARDEPLQDARRLVRGRRAPVRGHGVRDRRDLPQRERPVPSRMDHEARRRRRHRLRRPTRSRSRGVGPEAGRPRPGQVQDRRHCPARTSRERLPDSTGAGSGRS